MEGKQTYEIIERIVNTKSLGLFPYSILSLVFKMDFPSTHRYMEISAFQICYTFQLFSVYSIIPDGHLSVQQLSLYDFKLGLHFSHYIHIMIFNDLRTTRESTVPITRGITEIFFNFPSKHYPDWSVLNFHYRNYDGIIYRATA